MTMGKKNLTRTLSLLIIMVFVLSLFPSASFASENTEKTSADSGTSENTSADSGTSENTSADSANPNECQIVYDSNGGDGSVITDSVGIKTHYTIKSQNFSKTGYCLDRWNTKPDGSGFFFLNDQPISISGAFKLKLYAQWEKNPTTCTITYDSNGGAGSTESEVMKTGTKYTVVKKDYSKDNCIFKGWNTKPDGSGESYANGQIIDASGNITLYAQWEIISSESTDSESTSSDSQNKICTITIKEVPNGYKSSWNGDSLKQVWNFITDTIKIKSGESFTLPIWENGQGGRSYLGSFFEEHSGTSYPAGSTIAVEGDMVFMPSFSDYSEKWLEKENGQLEKENGLWLREEKERLAQEKEQWLQTEKQRLETEKEQWLAQEKERVETENEQQLQTENERIEQENAQRIEQEKERLKKEKEQWLEQEKEQWLSQETERLETEKQQWLEKEKERLETEKQQWLEQENERIEKEKERLETEKEQWLQTENERLETEKEQRLETEKERLEKEKQQWLEKEIECFETPLVLDLDGNGVKTIPIEQGVQFDYAGNGRKLCTAWVDPGDGLLVRGTIGNGQIVTGADLFGNYTPLKNGKLATHGFEALAEFDSNGDGIVDRDEAEAAGISVWKDANSNGVADPGELLKMEEVGIWAIEVGYTASDDEDENGCLHKWQGAYLHPDKTKSSAVDVIFKTWSVPVQSNS